MTIDDAWINNWHLWRIVLPKRSITGTLLWGQVWRRRDYNHWIYKEIVEYADGQPANANCGDNGITG